MCWVGGAGDEELAGPVVEVSDLAAGADALEAGEWEVDEEPWGGSGEGAGGEDAVVREADVDWGEGGWFTGIDVEGWGPWGGSGGGGLEDEALLFEGAGAAAEADAVIAGVGVGAAGDEEDGGAGFG